MIYGSGNNMKAKTANNIFMIALVAGAIISGLGSTNGTQWLAILGMVIMCGGLIIKVLYCRCPHCGGFIGRSSGEFCQYCGKKLEE